MAGVPSYRELAEKTLGQATATIAVVQALLEIGDVLRTLGSDTERSPEE